MKTKELSNKQIILVLLFMIPVILLTEGDFDWDIFVAGIKNNPSVILDLVVMFMILFLLLKFFPKLINRVNSRFKIK